MTLTYIVPTLGRPTLSRTLATIVMQARAGDVMLVVGSTQASQLTAESFGATFLEVAGPGGNWGAAERNAALPLVRTDYVTFLDDDDCAAPGARQAMIAAVAEHPGLPLIFRMAYDDMRVLWQTPELRCGNVGTPMFVVPNDRERLGRWGLRYEGDFDFIASCGWRDYIWRTDVIAQVRPS